MKLKIDFYEEVDKYGTCERQTIYSPDCNDIKFDVYNMYDCPEDAIIGRDLFTGDEYLEAVALGMKLAKAGYDDFDITVHTNEDEEEGF